jgi:hypothetical protein
MDNMGYCRISYCTINGMGYIKMESTMENKQTPLSEKEESIYEDYYYHNVFYVEDVKEAIKKLKLKADLDEWQMMKLKEIFGDLAE